MHQWALKNLKFKPHKLTIYEMGAVFSLFSLLSFSFCLFYMTFVKAFMKKLPLSYANFYY